MGATVLNDKTVYSVFNWGDNAVQRHVKLPKGKSKLVDKWTGTKMGVFENEYLIPSLLAHSAMLIEAIKN